MDAGTSVARQTRGQHRHELRTLTYVTLDQANGGVVRNLTREGIGLQVVAAVRPQQQLRVRFELRYPRLRVESRGEVVWATFSGQCGIRFLDLSPKTVRKINEWIMGDLLEGISLHTEESPFLVAESQARREPAGERSPGANGGLMLSAAPVKVIELPAPHEPMDARDEPESIEAETGSAIPLDWLSQPLSRRGLAWTVDALAVFAAMLLAGVVFLSVLRQVPRWPLEMIGGGAILIASMYWGFFRLFGGVSLGGRLAQLASEEEGEEHPRFR